MKCTNCIQQCLQRCLHTLLKYKSTLPPAHLVLIVGAGKEAAKLIFNYLPLPLAEPVVEVVCLWELFQLATCNQTLNSTILGQLEVMVKKVYLWCVCPRAAYSPPWC